ncbi:Mucin-associated surface protein (MASP) [Trypanosoma cruzi]|uniref:Mucin-associated surface protein (MASP), putative n=2 Tax=Trypanosoma cruzi TaxID=5693 RepID=Q4E4X3_TRYCC|nr:mucin-associated surface protein (MASP), putative [Trypanosoma cruzi]EAN99837.1 mucin-associated surface protein (MASP), putative [Trypanosoma cruzi]PWV21320.1 Mucin-associated surface protein (MASP) [Trypanosoma cruzi]RNC42108.1 mucin-associated surface protein (MASP) [Trypanosoma cruzi]|eukprot:XP_821688.1 mucin-associated surface protein (MASP) [Trypanosoma cruzi strain CL Brener]
MAMMTTGRVLLVCTLCVLWCGAGGRCENSVTAPSESGVNNPIIAPVPTKGGDLPKSNKVEDSKPLEDDDNHDPVNLPEQESCKNDSTKSPKCTEGPEVVIDSSLDPVGQGENNEVQNSGIPASSEKDMTLKDQELQERLQDRETLSREPATVKEPKVTMSAEHSSLPSPSKANQETVSSADIYGVGIGTVQRDNMPNTLTGNDGSKSRTAQPDSASINTQTSVDENTSSPETAPHVNTAADTDSAGSTTAALNTTNTKKENNADSGGSLAASPAVGTNTATATTTTTQDASEFSKDGVKLSTDDVEQNAFKTNSDADSGTTETAAANSEVPTAANNATNITSNTETTADSDVSTAVSHTTSPLLLLLLVACAAAAAVVAA